MQLVFNFFDDIAENNKICHAINCNKYQRQGLVYLGSKRGIADKIYHAIINTIGDVKAKRFVDLFCGGGAMGFCALAHGERVLMNDANEYLIYLLYSIVNYKIPAECKKDFIKREEYQRLKDLVANKSYFEIDCRTALRYALASAFFSFGGKFGKSYIYGADIEKEKELLHNIIIFKDIDALNILSKKYNLNLSMPIDENYYDRYISFKQHLQHLECLQHLEHLERLQHLECLQHLEHLERLQHLERLEFSSVDYADFKAEKGDIIYCDPPYENTEKYIKDVNHNSFLDWCQRQNNAVFISEYQDLTQYGFVKVFEIQKRQLLNKDSETKYNTEYLFWNGKK